MENISTKKILLELEKRGVITNSKSKNGILDCEDCNDVKIILAKGFPKQKLECTECRKFLDHSHYNFY